MKRALFCTIGLILAFSGCALTGKLGSKGELVNYALASNGGTVSASNYTPERDLYSVINGIKSSEGWDDGEGWECKFTRQRPKKSDRSRMDAGSYMNLGAAWLEVQFDGPKLINQVIIYNLDSKKYPIGKFGISDGWLQLWEEYGWKTVGEIEGGAVVSRANLDRKPLGRKVVFRFDPTETEKIRLVVFRSNDVEVIGSGSSATKTEKSTARIVEIEATGVGAKSDSGASGADSLEPAPEVVLESTDGEWVRLSNFRGKIVLLTFWASWHSASQRQIGELSALYNQYKDQGVAAIGISVDEGGAERIRPFLERSSIKYPILIADTPTKMAYGGIGKLPSTFVIDRNGNIYKKYFEYQGKHILELDIKRLLPSE